jgi:hypothetical protein
MPNDAQMGDAIPKLKTSITKVNRCHPKISPMPTGRPQERRDSKAKVAQIEKVLPIQLNYPRTRAWTRAQQNTISSRPGGQRNTKERTTTQPTRDEVQAEEFRSHSKAKIVQSAAASLRVRDTSKGRNILTDLSIGQKAFFLG